MKKRHSKFTFYYRQYKDKIYTYLYYRVNFNRDLAEDLCSEVFIKAFDNFIGFDEGRSFAAWIYTIARHHLINHYRLAGREVSLETVAEPAYQPVDRLHLGLECERLIEAIGELKPYYRDVLLLRYVDGLENSEIAEILDKDEGAVRTQISRAHEALREVYKE